MVNRPNCNKCIHYYITHDPDTPYGCRGMGFKSALNPALMVFKSSGLDCQKFRQKQNTSSKGSGEGGSRGGLVA